MPAEGREMTLWKSSLWVWLLPMGTDLCLSHLSAAVFLFALVCHDTDTYILDLSFMVSFLPALLIFTVFCVLSEYASQRP